MAVSRFCCTACDYNAAIDAGVWGTPKDCPKCGSHKTLMAERFYLQRKERIREGDPKEFARMGDEQRRAALLQRGVETEWKAIDVGGWTSLFGGTFSSTNIEHGLMALAIQGWEFVFFCDSAKAVGGPVMIFKRRIEQRPEVAPP